MNSKVLIAFISGAVLASGIVYFVVREEAPPRPRTEMAASSKPVPPQPPPIAASAPPPAVTPSAAPAAPPERERLSRTPTHEKPSPVPAARPATVARNQEPPPVQEAVKPPEPQPTPAPQPPPEQQPPAPEPAPAPVESVPAAPPAPEIKTPPTVTIAVGTILPVRIGETITVSHYRTGDSFLATLDQPLVVDGWVVAERGSRLEGRVVEAVPPSHTSDSSRLEIELVKLSTADGQRVAIHTQSYKKDAAGSSGHELAKIAGGTALGAAIGAAAGGGKGAAIGAGIGVAAGAATVALSHGKPAEIPVETHISFRIADPVTITERLN